MNEKEFLQSLENTSTDNCVEITLEEYTNLQKCSNLAKYIVNRATGDHSVWVQSSTIEAILGIDIKTKEEQK